MQPLPRLKRRADFLEAAASGRKSVSPGMILQARRHPTPSTEAGLRVGLTASRKVGNAVQRNRARRRLRHALQAVLPAHAAPGHDYVLIARAGTLTRDYKDLLEDLRQNLKKLGLYRA